jgi:hypothetical protein
MMIQVIIMHPQTMHEPEMMLVNAANIVCIGKFPISMLKYNAFSQQQEQQELQPPVEWYTMFLNSNLLPAVFIHKDSYSEIQAEFENLNINQF